MFERIKSSFKTKEKNALNKGIQKKIRVARNEILKKKDIVDHEINKLETEMERAFTNANYHMHMGNKEESVRLVKEAREADKALKVLYNSASTLSMYDGKLKLMQTRLLSKDVVSRATKIDNLFGKDTEFMIERFSHLEQQEEPYNDFDLNHLERTLDTPMYSPSRHDEDYLATKVSIESMTGYTPKFQNYLKSIKEDLIATKNEE